MWYYSAQNVLKNCQIVQHNWKAELKSSICEACRDLSPFVSVVCNIKFVKVSEFLCQKQHIVRNLFWLFFATKITTVLQVLFYRPPSHDSLLNFMNISNLNLMGLFKLFFFLWYKKSNVLTSLVEVRYTPIWQYIEFLWNF